MVKLTMSDYSKGQNDFLKQFLTHEKTYLDHLLNLEMPPPNLSCHICGLLDGEFRCLDCYGPQWCCRSCLLNGHGQHPFHRLQQWKGGSFENVSLCELGYVLNLGHSPSGGNAQGKMTSLEIVG